MALHMLSTGITFTDFGNTGHTPVSELLGDYEYGTYSPTLTPLSSGTISVGVGCRYIQIGVMVTVSGRMECSGSSSPAGLAINISVPITLVHSDATFSVGSSIQVSTDGSSTWATFPVVNWGDFQPRIYGLTVANVNNNYRFQPFFNYQAAMA